MGAIIWGLLALAGALQPAPRSELELSWTAPAPCPAGPAVLADVERLLGRPLSTTRDGGIRAIAIVSPASRGFELVLELVDAGGRTTARRVLRDDRCETLAEVAALFLALGVDPFAVAERDERPVEPTPVPAPARVPTPEPIEPERPTEPVAAAVPTAHAKPPERRLRALVRAAGVVAGFVLPGAAVGVLVAAGLLHRRFRVELGGSFFPDRGVRDATFEGVGLLARMGAVELRAGPRFSFRGGVELGPAVGIEAGAISARGFGVDDPQRRTSAWLAATPGVLLAWAPGGRLAAGVQVDLIAPILRPGFGIENLGELHRPEVVGVRAVVGLEIRVP